MRAQMTDIHDDASGEAARDEAAFLKDLRGPRGPENDNGRPEATAEGSSNTAPGLGGATAHTNISTEPLGNASEIALGAPVLDPPPSNMIGLDNAQWIARVHDLPVLDAYEKNDSLHPGRSFDQRTTDPETINRWFTDAVGQPNERNVAFVLGLWKGRRRIGFDFDAKDGRPGVENHEIMVAAGLIPADSLTFRTKSHGLHVVAEVEGDLWLAMNAVNWKGEGVEGLNLIERDGRTGVDIRGENGVLYTVGSEMRRGGAYKVERNARIAPLPAKGVAVFGSARKAGSRARASFDAVPDRFEDDWSIRESIKIIEDSTAVDGEKHDEFYRMANEVFDLGPTPEWFISSFLDHWPLAHTWTQDLEREVESIVRQRMAIGRAWGCLHRPSVYLTFDVVRLADPAAMGPRAPDDGFDVFSIAELGDEDPPDREWIVPDVIPSRTVTLFMGNGGVGKSTSVMQLGASYSLRRDWLGMPTGAWGRSVLFITAEDERVELHRRILAIGRAEGFSTADMAEFHAVSLVGRDTFLANTDRNGAVSVTPEWRKLVAAVKRFDPKLVVIDTLAAFFGGNEIARVQVRQFANLLSGLAACYDLAVVLIGHPSQSGMSSGEGTSGSTDWHNAFRARLYLHEDKDDPSLRVLEVMKQNYGPGKGAKHYLRWDNGRYAAEEKRAVAEVDVESFLMRKIEEFLKRGQNVSANSGARTGTVYAPLIIAKDSEAKAKGIGQDALVKAMNDLLTREWIFIDKVRTSSAPTGRPCSACANHYARGRRRFAGRLCAGEPSVWRRRSRSD
jgi:RecA-family ATPase